VVVKMVKKALLAVQYHFQSNVRPTGRRSKLSEAARAECKRDLARLEGEGVSIRGDLSSRDCCDRR
jgi:hypothetical protein